MIDCKGCPGLCCKNADRIVSAALASKIPEEVKHEYRSFPYRIGMDGSCEMLDGAGRCKVYATRPLVCDLERFHRRFSGSHDYEALKVQLAGVCAQIRRSGGPV